MTKDARSQENLSQTQVQGQVNGELFDLGAGPVQIALLAAYRKNTYEFSPDADLVSPNAFNLVVPGNPGGNIEGVVNTLPVPHVAIDVKELAAQIDVPLLAGRAVLRGARGRRGGARLRLFGHRIGHQLRSSTRAGGRSTTLLFRGSYQRAVRAPNIGELFSPPQGAQLVIGTPPGALGDPCDVRSTARTGANGAQVAALCVAQGVPARRDQQLPVPDHRDRAGHLGQHRPSRRRRRTRSISASSSTRPASGGLARRPLVVGRLLQHQDQGRHLDGARA